MYTVMDMCSGKIERSDVSAVSGDVEMAGAVPEDRVGVSLQFASPDNRRRVLPPDLALCDVAYFLQGMERVRD